MSRKIQGKTEDGISLATIVRAASEMPMVFAKKGTNHQVVLYYKGLPPCPVSTSSNVKRMIAPWLRRVTGYSNDKIYSALKAGTWYR